MIGFQKTAAHRNPKLLAMARGKPCLIQMPWCDGGGETTVAAHSNQMKHGKGKGRKADDEYTVWACYSCHAWLDQGKGSRQEKDEAFELAHASQILAWREIVDSGAKGHEAARWALEKLGVL